MLLRSSLWNSLDKAFLFFLSALSFIAFFVPAQYAQAQAAFNGATTVLAPLPSTDTLSPLAVDSNGDMFYVVNNGSTNTLFELPSGGSLRVLNSAFPYLPSALAVNPSGTALYMIYTASTASCNTLTYQRVAMVSTVANSTPTDLPQCFTNFGYNGFYSDPTGLATDSSGNLYVADFGGGVIWRLSAAVSPSTYPTAMMALVQQPYDIAVLGSTIYYTALNASSTNTLYDVSSSNFTTGIPTGAASSSSLATVGSIQSGLAVDSSGNVYIGGSTSIQKYSSGSLTTYASVPNGVIGLGVDSAKALYLDGFDSSGNPFVGEFTRLAINAGNVNVGATSSTVSLSFTIAASSSTTIGSVHIYTTGADNLDFVGAGGSTCTAKTYSTSTNCAVNVSFKPRYAGLRMGAVVLVDGSGNAIATVLAYGNGVGPQLTFANTTSGVFLPSTLSTLGSGLNSPHGVAVDASGNIYIANTNSNNVLKETLSGGSYTQTTIASGLSTPEGVTVDGGGNVYIADTGHNQVVKEAVSGSGYTQSTIVSGLNAPYGVAVDGSGNIYIANTSGNNVLKETLSGGSYTQTIIASGLNVPQGVTVDGSGNVYIADTGNNQVLKEALSGGTYTKSTIVSGLSGTEGAAVDGGGNVYIADTLNNQLLKEALSGGTYTQAIIASGLSAPAGVAVDGSGNVYIANSNTNQVEKLDYANPPALSFANTAVGVQSSDSPQTVTISNNGNATLTFPTPTSGRNPSIASGFQLDSATTCPQLSTSSPAGTLAVGAHCTYAIDFIPVASGTDSGSAVLTDNSLNAAGPGYAKQTISLSGTAAQITLSPTSLPAGTVGTVYSQTLTASGGVGPYTFAETSGSLPPGISLSSSGTLSGTPTSGGTFSFTITVTDANNMSRSQAYTLTLNAPTITLSPPTLPDGTSYVSYSQTLVASGATAPYTFAVTAGALPAGLSLSSIGVISGTPTAAGTFNFTVTATDSSTGGGAPYTSSRAYSLVIGAPTITVSPASLPSATDGVSYSQALTATGGTAPYTYTVTSGVLPSGITLSSSGTLSGTPTAGGTFSLTITATDANNVSKSQAYTLTVNAPTITLSPPTLPGGTSYVSYSQTLVASGATAPYTFAVTAGALPAGLTVNTATGAISGTPTATGTFNFTVTATDSSTGSGAPYSGSRAYSLVVSPPSITVSPASLPSATDGVSYSQALSTAGGTAPYTYAVTSGALPAGLNLSTAGVLSGTSAAGGTFSFTITVTDVHSFTAAQAYLLIVSAATVTVSPASVPGVTYGGSYSQIVSAAGGVAPYTFAVTAGALPGGLTLNAATGAISGTEAGAGTYNFMVTATDSSTGTGPYTGSRAYSLTVNLATLTATANNASRFYGTVNPAFTGTVTGAVNGDTFTEGFTTAAVTTSNVGTYAIAPSVSGANLAGYSVVIQNGTLTITQAASTTTLGVSSTSITPGQSVMLTANVTPATSGAPTGTVSFYDGTTLLGVGILASGTANLSTTAISSATTHVLTAAYSGDVDFLASSSTASTSVVVAPLDFTLTLSTPAIQTVVPGSAITYQVVVNPLYGSYAGPISFTVTGLPAGATATFSPATILANGGKQTVVVTIQTQAVALAHPDASIGRRLAPLTLALLFLPLFGAKRIRRQGRHLRQWLCMVLLLGGLAVAVTGCGSNNGFFTQAQKSYDVTITATAGSLQHSATVTVEVQ